MDKQEEYQQQARIIGEIFAQLWTTLSDKDREWLTSIFCLTAVLDDIVDSNKQESAPWIILGILESWIMSQSWDSLPSEEIKKLREHLLSLPDGEMRLRVFIRTLKILFRQTKELSVIKTPSAYFRASILEWRMFGKMVWLWITEMKHLKKIQQAWWMENLTDDILDVSRDFKNKERKMSPSMLFYINWLQLTVAEILNMHNKFGTTATFHSLKVSLPYMIQKYIVRR